MTVTKEQIEDIQLDLNNALKHFKTICDGKPLHALSYNKYARAIYWDGKIVALTKVLQILHS